MALMKSRMNRTVLLLQSTGVAKAIVIVSYLWRMWRPCRVQEYRSCYRDSTYTVWVEWHMFEGRK